MNKRTLLVVAFYAGLLLAGPVLANVGGSSTRVPLTDFLVELYNVTSNVYVPLICLGVIVIGAGSLLTGAMRIGPTLARIFLVVGILGLGVAWFGQTIGASVAIAVIA
jgi:hypothetical protein